MKPNAAKPAPEPKIGNRADLIQALTVASQLEHGLMLMYLYAAFSMKAFPEELGGYNEPPDVLRNKLRNWEASILRVARQEMEHLVFVCNMLSDIGGNQYFDRPNFPQERQYWPVNLPIELERFGVVSLLRFLEYERPQNLVDPEVDALTGQAKKARLTAPQPVEPKFTSIGDLYNQIRTAFQTLPEDQLFIVPPADQVNNDTLFGEGSMTKPTYDMFVFKVWDRQSAVNAVDEIIEQGEGTLTKGPVTIDDLDPECHYMLFRRVLMEYIGNATQLEPLFEGARNCVRNPAWELHQDTITRTVYSGSGPQPPLSVAVITHPWTREMMGISNTAYEALMQMLIRLYTFAGDTPAEVDGIVQTAFFPMMTMVIRPLSELMSLLPAFVKFEGNLTAGPGFEFFRTIGFLPHKPAAWITIYEQLQTNAENFTAATKVMPPEIKKYLEKQGYRPEVALPFIGQNLGRIAMNFKTYMKF
jgi:hypothetical protein